jgi:ABC-type sugar transport system ATPase subunit
MDPIVVFEDISKHYGDTKVLDSVNLSIDVNDFMVIYGLPSSGKSILLRLLTGLEKPDNGKVILRGKNVNNIPAKERRIGYVPQDFALFPHKSVYENIAYPLRILGQPNREIKPVVERTAGMLHISDLLLKLPTQLSGGQKQRVAIARGIVKNTDIFVLDDPLAGLDFKLREQLFDDLKVLQEKLKACFIYTTSDPIEALSLGSKIAVLHNSTVQEIGEPEKIYTNPQSIHTMDILGFPRSNFIKGTLITKASEIWCKTELFEFRVNDPMSSDSPVTEVTVGIRPESIYTTENNNHVSLDANVYLCEDLGGEDIVYLDIQGRQLQMIKSSNHQRSFDVDDKIKINLHSTALLVFDTQNGKRIGEGVGELNV